MTRIGVADDHTLLREGVINLLKSSPTIEVVAEADTVSAAKQMLDAHPTIDILLCDINFPDGEGYELLEHIKRYNKTSKIIYLTMHDKSSYATKAIDAGASGYLTKDAAREELLLAIETVKSGKKYFGQQIMTNIVDNINRPQRGQDYFKRLLSKRELEVLELIVEGLETHEIAEKLFISEKTAANYRVSIIQKCQVKNVVQLIKLYLHQA